jgi:hypothetical protein
VERSVTGPVFVEACEDLLRQLRGDSERTALVLRARLSHLSELFKLWELERPNAGERADALNELIDLNRSALIYFSKKTSPVMKRPR